MSGPAAAIGTAPVAPRPQPAPPPPAPEPQEALSDAELLRDLQETLAPVKRPPPAPQPVQASRADPVLEDPAVESTLEDEMSKLLADLTRDNDGKAG